MERKDDRLFMKRALFIAERGRGSVSPNPMVGAVVVRNGEIVGEGWHQKAGEPHAEVYALREAGDKTKSATLYVTLEPCCHYGKTPPCTNLIIKSCVERVVVAMMDENPLVCGNGCASLEAAGIRVDVGLMEHEARRLNEAFIKYIRTDTPFVTLKLASTLDGRIADTRGKSAWLTGTEARRRVHQLRAWTDAVMIGIGTALADNPRLTVRDTEGGDPLRVVVDSKLRLPRDAKVVGDGRLIIATTDAANEKKVRAFESKGAAVWRFPDDNGHVPLAALLARLCKERRITSVLCEGGGTLAGALIDRGLVDKAVFMFAPKILGGGVRSVAGMETRSIADALTLDDVEIEQIENDVIVSGYLKNRNIL